jgi:hypothetical protein
MRLSQRKIAGAGLAVFLTLLLYDGAIRKWILPLSEQLVFVAKDLALFGCVALLIGFRSFPANLTIHRALVPFAAIYLLWILLSAFNPWLPNAAVALWGLKSHLLYALGMLLMVPMVFSDTTAALRRLVSLYPWIVIPVCMLGIAQVLAPVDSALNAQIRGDSESVAYFGSSNLVRVSGTFSYISGMGAFVQIVVLLGIGLLLAGARGLLFLGALALAFASLPIAGSRAVVLVTLLGAATMIGIAPFAGLLSVKRTVFIFVCGGILLFLSSIAMSDAWVALQERTESTFEETNRAITAFTNAFDYFDQSGMAGFGTGAANLGAPAFAKDIPAFSWIPGNVLFEEESGRLVLELGILGWMLSVFFRIGLLVWALSLALRGRTVAARTSAVLALPALALALHVGVGVFAPPVWSAYVWFCVTLLSMAQYEHLHAISDENVGHYVASRKHQR